jgi:hypothetical protein
MNNINKKNETRGVFGNFIDVNQFRQVNMDMLERVARANRPKIAKVVRLTDWRRPDGNDMGCWEDEIVRLKLTMDDGTETTKNIIARRDGCIKILAMRAKAVVGMTEAELGDFLERAVEAVHAEWAVEDAEAKRRAEENRERAEYERLRRKFG